MGQLKSDLTIHETEFALANSMPARVARIEQLTTDVIGLWLNLLRREKFESFLGQHLESLFRDGSHQCYSFGASGRLQEGLSNVDRATWSDGRG